MKKINLSFFILVLIIMQVTVSDTLIYFLNLKYGIANVIAFTINILLVVFFIRKQYISIKINFYKWDIVFFITLLLIMCCTIVIPDTFWDTYSYHIYLQENPFADKINEDFFPGRTLTSFISPIADRVFYMFRVTLGYRLGTFPTYFLMVVIFYECKKILKSILKEKANETYISILSILPICTFIIMQQLGTYYIDNFCIAMLLEIIYMLLAESKDIFKNKPNLYFLILIVGIAISIKITNAIYVALPLMIILIKNIKDIKLIKWYDYIFLMIVVFMPILPYMTDSIIQTGSPVFPYYNKIFKSEYYEQTNWLDNRYGPKSIIEYIIWPLYIIKHPERAYEGSYTDISFAIGYIISITYLAHMLYKKIIKKEKIEKTDFIYCVTLVSLYFLWEKFVIGYTRYAGIICILSNLLTIKILLEEFYKKRIIVVMIITIILCIGSYKGFMYGVGHKFISIFKGDEATISSIKENTKQIFTDKNNTKYDINGIWGVIYDDSAVPMLLNVDDRIVHLEYGFKTGESDKSKKIYWDNILNNEIYVPMYNIKIDGKLDYFDKFHFEIIEITDVIKSVSSLQKDETIYIVKVKYNDQIEKNSGKNKEIFNELLKQI